MHFDWLHMIATALVIIIVFLIVDHLPFSKGWSKKQRLLAKFFGILMLLIIVNILRPYTSGN